MAVTGSLVAAGLRHRPARYAVLALGIALAVALPVLGQASAAVVATRTLVAAIDALPPGDRSLTVTYGGAVDPTAQQADDAFAREQLAHLTSAPARRETLYRKLSDGHGNDYYVGAADDLATGIRVTSGRAPAPCTPTRCEVVVTGPGPAPVLDPALGLVVVGTAVRTDPLLLAGTFDPGAAATLLLADGAAAAERIPALADFPRSSGWVAPLDPPAIARTGVPAYLDASREVANAMSLTGQAFVLTAPDDALAREDARAQSSTGRFAVLGGAAAVLVLGLALVAAVGLRREHAMLTGLLRRRGASRRSVARLTALLAGATVLVGVVVGLAAAALAAALLAAGDSVGPAPAKVAGEAVLAGLPMVLVLAVAAAVVTVVALLWPSSSRGAAWRTAELLAVAALAAAGLAAARGAITATPGSQDPLLTALPVLVCLAGGLLAARLWAPAAALSARWLPARAGASRLALVGAVRRPLVVVTTVGFVTAAVASVVFSGAYRATLLEGAADQAAFQVPLDARLLAGIDNVSPLQVVVGSPTLGTSYPVVRSAAGVRTSATSATPATLLGVDPDVLPAVARWSRLTGDSDPAAAATAVTVPERPQGMTLPDAATTLTIPLAGIASSDYPDLLFIAWVGAQDGREAGVRLTAADGRLTGALPDLGPGRRLRALTLQESELASQRRQHHTGEGGSSTELVTGTALLGTPRTDAGAAAGGWDDWSTTTATGTVQDGRLRLGYQLSGQLVVVRPGLAQRPPLQVLADPATVAAAGRNLRLDVGGTAVAATVVGTLAHFPTVPGPFLVLDEHALADALDDVEPGTGPPREIWVSDSDPTLPATLAAAPYDRLSVTVQSDVRDRLASDPVAQGSSWLLAAGALVALLVGAIAVVLLVIGARRDDAGELLALEADGVAPGTLRRVLFLRAAYVAVPAVIAGAITGVLLARAAATLVAISATGTTPLPPLALAVGVPWTAGVVGAIVVLALVAAAVTAGGAMREPWPARPQEELL
jgi:hypothetical protein